MSERTQYQSGTESEQNNQIMVDGGNCEYEVLTIGDRFKHTDDGRTVTIENIRYETSDDKQRPNHRSRIELSNGKSVGDTQLATALNQDKITRI